MPEIKQDIRVATFVVAANDSLHKNMADYVCDGTNDNVEIQAALDALPTTGGEVFLLDGTYNIEASLVLDSYQTLRGCGRNTILTTSTDALVFLSAVGGAGTEKTGINIVDLQIDGSVGISGDFGIYFEYVDYSYIQNVYSRRSLWSGIHLLNSDFNTIVNNTCQEEVYGICLDTSNNNIVSGNTCQKMSARGIDLETSNNNIVSGNTCQENGNFGICINTSNNNIVSGNICQETSGIGIDLDTSNNNIVSGNICQKNISYGIRLIKSDNNTVSSNTYVENSQDGDNTYEGIFLNISDYNHISNNTCRKADVATTLTGAHGAGETAIVLASTTGFWAGGGITFDPGGGSEETDKIASIEDATHLTLTAGLTNPQINGEEVIVPRTKYGITITGTCDHNMIHGNNLYQSGQTGDLNDGGTNTHKRDNLSNAGAWLADV